MVTASFVCCAGKAMGAGRAGAVRGSRRPRISPKLTPTITGRTDMKLSTDRILTTHVGSLPRPKAVVDLMVAKDHGEKYDFAELNRMVHQTVADLVERQVQIGVDVVSDGEASKIGYGTYIKERLTGFG